MTGVLRARLGLSGGHSRCAGWRSRVLSCRWLPLEIMLNCNRIKTLTSSTEVLRAAVASSTTLALNEAGDKLRRVVPFVAPTCVPFLSNCWCFALIVLLCGLFHPAVAFPLFALALFISLLRLARFLLVCLLFCGFCRFHRSNPFLMAC